jgi:hypothetical protein
MYYHSVNCFIPPFRVSAFAHLCANSAVSIEPPSEFYSGWIKIEQETDPETFIIISEEGAAWITASTWAEARVLKKRAIAFMVSVYRRRA